MSTMFNALKQRWKYFKCKNSLNAETEFLLSIGFQKKYLIEISNSYLNFVCRQIGKGC